MTRTAFLLTAHGLLAIAGCGTSTTPSGDTGTANVDAGVDAATAVDTGSGTDGGVDAAVAPTDTGADAPIAPNDANADAGHRVPANHRPDDAQCQGTAPAGNCSFGGGGFDCDTDADCTAGTNGRCNQNIGGAAFCRCTYDTCQQDTECGTGETCACHGATFHADSNECVAGNCRVDSDCGTQGYCSPTIGGCGGLAGYYCHTTSDLCVDDADCTGGGLPESCQYVSTSSRWECVERQFCP